MVAIWKSASGDEQLPPVAPVHVAPPGQLKQLQQSSVAAPLQGKLEQAQQLPVSPTGDEQVKRLPVHLEGRLEQIGKPDAILAS